MISALLMAVVLVLCTGCPPNNGGGVTPWQDTTVTYRPLTPESNYFIHLYNISNSLLGKTAAEVSAIMTADGYDAEETGGTTETYVWQSRSKDENSGSYMLANAVTVYYRNGVAVSAMANVQGQGDPVGVPGIDQVNVLTKAIGEKPATPAGDQLRFVMLYTFSGMPLFKYADVASTIDAMDSSAQSDDPDEEQGGASYIAFWAGTGYTLDLEELDLEGLTDGAQEGRVSVNYIMTNCMDRAGDGYTMRVLNCVMMVSTAKFSK